MADKKVDATTGEVQDSLTKKEILALKKGWVNEIPINPDMDENPVIHTIHCKPAYNYQSVEFDWAVHQNTTEDDWQTIEFIYSKALEMLVRMSEKAPQVEAKKPVAPVEEPASEKQKEILRNFHIDFKPDITKKQAHALIKKSMDQEIF